MTLITAAHAAGNAQAANPNDGFSLTIMLVGFALIFYFLVWRPQNQRQKEQQQLLTGLKKGDEVVTSGGILGRITDISDDFVSLSISDGVDIKLQKSYITASLPKGTLKSI